MGKPETQWLPSDKAGSQRRQDVGLCTLPRQQHESEQSPEDGAMRDLLREEQGR